MKNYILIKIPPKHSVAEVVGYIKGKSVIAVARQFGTKRKILMERGSEPETMPFR